MKHFQLSDTTLKHCFVSWSKMLDRGETANIFFAPYAGRDFRVAQFQTWYKKRQGANLILIDFALKGIEDGTDLLKIPELRRSSSLLILTNSQLNDYLNSSLMRAIERSRSSFGTKFLIFHELIPVDLYQNSYKNILPSVSASNISVFPLHTFSEVMEFANNICRYWKIRLLDDAEMKMLFDFCGGYFWLVKEVLRIKRDKKVKINEKYLLERSLTRKADVIWSSLPNPVKTILRAVASESKVNHLLPRELDLLKMIQDFRIIQSDQDQPLPKLLQRAMLNDAQRTLVLGDGKIECNGLDISHFFSGRQKRVIQTLFKKPGELISRDKIAEMYWGQDWIEKYSDWALDQAMLRLRKKIKQASLPISIKPVRNQGYALR